VGENWDKGLSLAGSILTVSLNEHKDSFIWTASKNFSVKNMYNDLELKLGIPVNCWTWKAKISLKIKIFICYLKNGMILTKDNLVKRQRKGCTPCCFCSEQESIQHLFFDCPMARLMCESASRPLSIFGELNDKMIKGLIYLSKFVSRFILKLISNYWSIYL
jgi:hypothetical protein